MSTSDTSSSPSFNDRQIFRRMRQELQALQRKIVELDGQKDEHELVMKAINSLDPNRRCYRMIGGVLIERTVGEVLPALDNNRGNIAKTIVQLRETADEREKQMTKFALDHGLASESPTSVEEQPPKTTSTAESGVGVLV